MLNEKDSYNLGTERAAVVNTNSMTRTERYSSWQSTADFIISVRT